MPRLTIKLKRLMGQIPREAWVFAIRGAILLAVWKLLYGLILLPNNLVDPQLTRLTAEATYWIVKVLFASHSVQLIHGNAETIYLDHRPMVFILSACNGLSLYALFIGFICSIPVGIKRMAAYVLSGMVFIFALNVIRCAALLYLNYHHFKILNIAHHYIFQYTVYLAIFLIWESYFKSAKLSHETAEA